MFIVSLIFLVLILVVIVVIILVRRIKCSEKNKERAKNLKYKVFFNPIIKYLQLNSLKLNLSGIMVIKAITDDEEMSITNMATGISIVALVNLSPIVMAIAIWVKNDELD